MTGPKPTWILAIMNDLRRTRTTRAHNWTAGKIYESIIRKERRGEYLGKTVQVIPHVTDEIKSAFLPVADGERHRHRRDRRHGGRHREPALSRSDPPDAARPSGRRTSLFVHLTLVPYIGTSGELKTKPTQHSVKELRAIGIQPDILLCRDGPLPDARHQEQDLPLHATCPSTPSSRPRTWTTSTKFRSSSPEKGWTRSSSSCSSSGPKAATWLSWRSLVNRIRASRAARSISPSSGNMPASRTPT